MLRERGIPLAFVTGFDQSRIPERFADVPYMGKPHNADALALMLEPLCASAGKAA